MRTSEIRFELDRPESAREALKQIKEVSEFCNPQCTMWRSRYEIELVDPRLVASISLSYSAPDGEVENLDDLDSLTSMVTFAMVSADEGASRMEGYSWPESTSSDKKQK